MNPIDPEFAALAADIVARTVWCTFTTVSPAGEPRSRLQHPVWFWSDRPEADQPVVGLVTSRPTPIKQRHLAAHPRASCAYWGPHHDTVVFDALARWVPDDGLADAWARIASVPEPVGFDPASIWPAGPASPDFRVIELQPYRIVARPAGQPPRIWRAAP